VSRPTSGARSSTGPRKHQVFVTDDTWACQCGTAGGVVAGARAGDEHLAAAATAAKRRLTDTQRYVFLRLGSINGSEADAMDLILAMPDVWRHRQFWAHTQPEFDLWGDFLLRVDWACLAAALDAGQLDDIEAHSLLVLKVAVSVAGAACRLNLGEVVGLPATLRQAIRDALTRRVLDVDR
jgi:hypothetical protein